MGFGTAAIGSGHFRTGGGESDVFITADSQSPVGKRKRCMSHMKILVTREFQNIYIELHLRPKLSENDARMATL